MYVYIKSQKLKYENEIQIKVVSWLCSNFTNTLSEWSVEFCENEINVMRIVRDHDQECDSS